MNSYVVLSDGETYDEVDVATLYVLSDRGAEQLNDSNDLFTILDQEISERIPLRSLVDAYNQVHGTNL